MLLSAPVLKKNHKQNHKKYPMKYLSVGKFILQLFLKNKHLNSMQDEMSLKPLFPNSQESLHNRASLQ